jgi:hypothetical protein
MIQQKDSTLWIGTSGGLNRFDPVTETFAHYTMENGLPDDEIKCIIEDDDGSLWLSTNKGICQFDLVEETFRNYDHSDGLQGNEFNIRSGIKTKRGELVFGGNNGFNVFRSAQLRDNQFIPPVVITDFKIFNKAVPIGGKKKLLSRHISETRQLDLSYRHSVFSFEFVALNYVSPARNQYAYMMEGFESDWNYVGTRRTATYTNLDPGEYVFRVKASNNDGIWNEEGEAVYVNINPPFWKTWWAYLLQALLVIGVITIVLSYYISRQKLKNVLRIEHLELEKMYEIDQMKTSWSSILRVVINFSKGLRINVIGDRNSWEILLKKEVFI